MSTPGPVWQLDAGRFHFQVCESRTMSDRLVWRAEKFATRTELGREVTDRVWLEICKSRRDAIAYCKKVAQASRAHQHRRAS